MLQLGTAGALFPAQLPMSAYAVSKLANILFTSALQRRHPNILCTSCNPGGVKTEGGLSVWPWFLKPVMNMLFA